MTTLYGIKNCDTMKKARSWLDGRKIAYAFHDYKASGIDKATLEAWIKQVGSTTSAIAIVDLTTGTPIVPILTDNNIGPITWQALMG